MLKIKKFALAASLVGLITGIGGYSQSALALTGIQVEPCTSCPSTVNIWGNNSSTNSLLSNTGNDLNASAFTFNISGLTSSDLVATQTHAFSVTNQNGTISGNILSDVFKYNGSLLFGYQFDITQLTGQQVVQTAGISPFNAPGNTAYNLAMGVMGTAVSGLSGTGLSNIAISSFFNNPTTLTMTYGSGGTVIGGNNTVINLGANEISPMFFMDTNAQFYGTGIMTVQSSTFVASADVFVPNTPEPGTIILFGSGLALLSMIILRKRSKVFEI